MNYPKISASIYNALDDNQRDFLNIVQEHFPDVIKDGIVDFDALKEAMGNIEQPEGEEKYELTWAGKHLAKREYLKEILGKTLKFKPQDSLNADTTENLYIEGDNLEVMKLLKRNYRGKIKMIYIDPPYNRGDDLVYNDTFKYDKDEFAIVSNNIDEVGNPLQKNTKEDSRFHSKWLNMMYPRLRLAKELLSQDGVIFISIDDNEQADLTMLCNEIFGNDNHLACFPRVTKKAGKTTDAIAKNHDYVLVYCKTNNYTLYLPTHTDEGFKFCDDFENTRGKYKLNQTLDYDSLQYSPSLDYPIEYEGEIFYPGGSFEKYLERKKGNHARADWAWRWSKDLYEYGLKNGFIVVKKYDSYSRIYTKTYQNCKIIKTESGFEIEYMNRTKAISSLEFVDNLFSNDNSKKNLLQIFETSVFDYSKPISLLKDIAQYATKSDDIIIDFFSGSATTAHAVMQLNAEDGGNRKFIMVQIPEKCDDKSEAKKAGFNNICEIGKERIRRAGKKIKEDLVAEIESIKKEIEKEREKWNREVKRSPFIKGNGCDSNQGDFKENNEKISLSAKADIPLYERGSLGQNPQLEVLEKLEEKLIKKEEILTNLDIGFKCFATADTNIQWIYDEIHKESKDKSIHEYTSDNIKGQKDRIDFTPGFTDLDVVYELMLRQYGIPLSTKIEKLSDISDRTYIFADTCVVCLDDNITDIVVTKLAEIEPIPAIFVLRDSAFSDDIALKDYTYRKLNTLVNSHLTKEEQGSYSNFRVEFI